MTQKTPKRNLNASSTTVNMNPQSPTPADDADSDSDSEGAQEELCQPSVRDTPESDSDSDLDTPIGDYCRARDKNRNKPVVSSKKAPTTFPTAIPTFKPLSRPETGHESSGHANRLAFRSHLSRSPLAIFHRFVSNEKMAKISENTNAYALKKLGNNTAESGRRWTETTANELNCFFGIIMYMGVFRCSRLTDYWSTCEMTPRHNITKFMSLTRFQQIKRYLHINDVHGDNGRSFFLTKWSH